MGQKYGQHFLHDEQVLDDIAGAISVFKPTTVLEIGPGKGALTKRLVDQPFALVLSEVDTSLKPVLEKLIKGTSAQIVRGDVLEQSYKNSGEEITFGPLCFPSKEFIVVGNLPYYITSPIFRKFFFDTTIVGGGVFLIQKEVAEKIQSAARKKSYLRRLCNRAYEVKILRMVPARSFSPPPKVTSAVVIFTHRSKPVLDKQLLPKLLILLDLASPFKRKMLGKIRKINQQAFDSTGLQMPTVLLEKRLEELSREEVKNILTGGR